MGLFSFKKKVSWFKTGQNGTKIGVRRFPSEEYSIVITGLIEDSDQWNMARKIGYRANDQKTEMIKHFHEGAKFSPKEFQLIFPYSHVAEVDPDEKFLPAPETKIVGDHLKKLEPIGPNYLHESVFEYRTERFVENARGKIVSERQDNTNNPRFLIAETLSELDRCSDGFVQKMASGQILTPYDLRVFAGQIKRSHLPAEKDEKKLLYVQKSVAAAISRRFAKEFSRPTLTAYNFAVKLTENMPALIYGEGEMLTQARSEISTPLPITVAAQMLLGEAEHKRVFAPYAGNGAIIGILPESAYITALQLDESKKTHIRRLRPSINLVQTDIVDTQFDQKAELTISDLPSGDLDCPTQLDVGPLLYKKDQLALIRTLEEREDDGVSVFLLSSDQQDKFNREPGRIGPADEAFYKWLCSHYQVLGAIECHDELYAKQGYKIAKRLLLIGQKLSAGSTLFRSEADRLIIAQRSVYRREGHFHIEAAYSWQELWDKALFARAALLCHTDPDLIFDDPTQTPQLALSNTPTDPAGHLSDVREYDSDQEGESIKKGSTYVSHFETGPDLPTDEIEQEINQVIEEISSDKQTGVNTSEDYLNKITAERESQAEIDEQRALQNEEATFAKNTTIANIGNLNDKKTEGADQKPTVLGQEKQQRQILPEGESQNTVSDEDSDEFSFDEIFGKTADLPPIEKTKQALQSEQVSDEILGFSFDSILLSKPEQAPENTVSAQGPSKGTEPHNSLPLSTGDEVKQSPGLSAAQLADQPPSSPSDLMDLLAKPDASYTRELNLADLARQKANEIRSKVIRQTEHERLGKDEQSTPKEQAHTLLINSYRDFDPITDSGRKQAADDGEELAEISISEGSGDQELVDLKDNQNVFKKIAETQIDPSLILNELQAPYVTASQIHQSRSMAPRALIGAYARAFEKFQNQTKQTVDDYCAEQLQCDRSLLSKLYAEQIDACALALHAMGQGRGFVLGDKTGRGKGKSVASVARAFILKGTPVVFLTKKTNLFSDQWVDLQYLEIDQKIKPFVFNSQITVLNNAREPAFPVMGDTKKRKVMQDYVEDKISPFDEFNYFMLTYSQLGMLDTLKARFFQKLCANGAVLLMDESHIAAGSGNINFTVTQAVRHAKSVLYSSATYSKGAKNLAVYSKVFPPTINTDALSETLEAGGNPLLETLSTQMAEDGVYLSRESDTSKTMRVTLMNERDFFKNRAISDKHSEILAKIKSISDSIKNNIFPLVESDLLSSVSSGKAQEKIKISQYNFNAYLPRIMEQFDLSISTPMHVRNTLDALENNQKVIISLVNTNESAIVEILSSFEEDDSIRQQIDDLDPDLDADEIEKLQEQLQAQTKKALETAAKSTQTYSGLTYKELLKRFVNKICKIKAYDTNGVTHSIDVRNFPFKNLEKSQYKNKVSSLLNDIESLSEVINLFPSLPISPIDSIKDQIESIQVSQDIVHAEGSRNPNAPQKYAVGEISGRSFCLRQTNTDPNKPSHTLTLRTEDTNQTVNGFNDGLLDVIILTSSGSTGLSVHAGENFLDRRQRVFLIAQIHPDDTEQQQSEGRADRITQVCTPIIASSRNGLVYQDRRLAMANAKRRTASALTNSSSKNFRNMNDVPDLMTKTGEEVIANYLKENPDICSRIGLDFDNLTGLRSKDGNYFSKALFNGMCLLPSDLSEEITQEIYADLAFKIAEKEANGESENSTPELDIRAKTDSSKVFLGVIADGYLSRFEEPVLIQSISYREILEPMSYEDSVSPTGALLKKGVKTRCLESINRLLSKGLDYGTPSNKNTRTLNPDSPYLTALTKKYNDVCIQLLPSRYTSVKEALSSKEDNPIRQTREKYSLIKHYLEQFSPGSFIQVSLTLEGTHAGIIEALLVPSSERQLLNMGQYQVSISIPGRSKPIKRSFAGLLKDDSMRPLDALSPFIKNESDLNKAFEKPQSIITNKKALILSNNLLKAAEVVAQSRVTKPVIISDEKGVKKRVLFVKPGVTPDVLFHIPLKIPNGSIANLFAEAMGSHSTDFTIGTLDLEEADGSIGSSLSVSFKNMRVAIRIKENKSTIKKFVAEGAIKDLLISDFIQSKGEYTARVRADATKELFLRLYLENKICLRVPPAHRELLNETMYWKRVKNPRKAEKVNRTRHVA